MSERATSATEQRAQADGFAGREGQCCVCLGAMASASCCELPCGHTAHEHCALELRSAGASSCCPQCPDGDLAPAQAAFNLGQFHRRGGKGASYNLGTFHLHEGDLQRAQELLEDARRRGHPSAASNLLIVHERRGDVPAVMALLEEARQGGDPDAAMKLGVLCQEQGDLRRARELYAEAQAGGIEGASGRLTQLQGEARKSKPQLRGVILRRFAAGDPVSIQGSEEQALNDASGVVLGFDDAASRYCVEIQDLGRRAILEQHLVRVRDSPVPTA